MGKVSVHILAGGDSSRFGRDKAREMLNGVPMIIRVADSLRPVASGITVVADRPDKYNDLGLETIADQHPGLGPLGGIQAALSHQLEPGWILCASCDRVGICTDWLQTLLENTDGHSSVVAFRGEVWQPLPGLYHTSILAEVEEALSAGQRAPFRLFDRIQAVALPLPPGWENSVDINDRAALERWPGGG